MKKPNTIIPNSVAVTFHPRIQQLATALIDGLVEFEHPENISNCIQTILNEVLKQVETKVGNPYHTMCELADIKQDVERKQRELRYIAIHSEEVAVC